MNRDHGLPSEKRDEQQNFKIPFSNVTVVLHIARVHYQKRSASIQDHAPTAVLVLSCFA
jgi:hypothetical protein